MLRRYEAGLRAGSGGFRIGILGLSDAVDARDMAIPLPPRLLNPGDLNDPLEFLWLLTETTDSRPSFSLWIDGLLSLRLKKPMLLSLGTGSARQV